MAAKKIAKKSVKPLAPKSAAKKTATKPAIKNVAKPAAKQAVKKSAEKPTKKRAAKKSAVAAVVRPSNDVIAGAAYLNYRRRVEQGLPGDSRGDWLEAERQLVGGDQG